MKYKEFELDAFQEQAIKALLNDESVVVSAATGTGKTLIADYMIDHAIKNNLKVFYTAPIKALSNQKFTDFKESYGEQKVGLLTGDTVINPEAQVVVMTTEVYRNMLVEGSDSLDNLKYVVFDEIHFINDRERGTVWEESLIFSPEYVRFICLSATIPNYEQFAAWIESIAEHKVRCVFYPKRAVPLSHFVYDRQFGLTTIDKLEKSYKQHDDIPDYYNFTKKRRRHHKPRDKRRHKVANHIDIVKELKAEGWLPAIYFVFSRRATFLKAQELAKKFDFTTPETKSEILKQLREYITPDIADMPSIQTLRQVLPRGIGVHNAGLLPQAKQIVEKLFNQGLLQVLYATETFAVGINMPAKTVCFDAIEKYDGISFRYLNTKEYFQLAGRAGRRGIDEVGRSIVLVDQNKADTGKIKYVTEKDVEPIISQFKLSYNTVLNLIKNYDEDTIQIILQSNFGYFVKKQSKQQARISTSFNNYKRILEKLHYIENDKLTDKGTFATHIFTQEITITEFVLSELIENLSIPEINLLLSAIMYEKRRADTFYTKTANIGPIVKKIGVNRALEKKIKKTNLKYLYDVVTRWSTGKDFDELLEICNLAEGDLIRMFRQTIDLLRQIKAGLYAIKADRRLQDKIEECIKAIDRDLVSNTI